MVRQVGDMFWKLTGTAIAPLRISRRGGAHPPGENLTVLNMLPVTQWVLSREVSQTHVEPVKTFVLP